MLADAERECAQPAQHEPGVERTKHGAKNHVSVPNLVNPFLAAHHYTRDQV